MNKIYALLAFGLAVQFNAFAQNQGEITQALREHNCGVLFDFIQEPQGKDKQLIADAKFILRRYTEPDTDALWHSAGGMDTRVRSFGDFLMENVFLYPEKYLPSAVSKLTADVRNNFHKVKIIHDWMCYYIAYDADTFFGRGRGGQDYNSVIKNRKGVCAGYAALFNEMCRLAGIESIGISGYSKGYGYDEKRGASLDHEWNAVKINRRWYLVDVTWDAGYLDGSAFIRSYTTHYLFLDSSRFLYDHLPADNKYQFFAPVMTKEQFEKDANYKKGYRRGQAERIAIQTYEQTILPSLDDLLEKKRITEKEKGFFIAAYRKVPENGYYYFIEDYFAVERDNAVSRIRPLLRY